MFIWFSFYYYIVQSPGKWYQLKQCMKVRKKIQKWKIRFHGLWDFFRADKILKNLEPKRIEYISEWNLLEKSVKQAFCCTVSILRSVLHIFALYNLLGPGTSFYRKSKINIKRKTNYEIGWFHNWPMFHIDSMPFTLQTMIFRYNYKSNDVFYSPNSFYNVYLTALKNSKLKWIV